MDHIALGLTCFLATSFPGYLITIDYVSQWGFGDDLELDAFLILWPLLVVADILIVTVVL